MLTRILILQTAFIGDVILATPLIEKLAAYYPEASIDMLVRKGNEALLDGHPKLRKVWVLDKKRKYRSAWENLRAIRRQRYDLVVNLQRFALTGLLTAFSGGKTRLGFAKNPFSWTYSKKFPHEIGNGQHEVMRNLSLITALTDNKMQRPVLYPSPRQYEAVRFAQAPYICIAPTSVWFTKQWAASKWVELLNALPKDHTIYLLGAPSDKAACQQILEASQHPNVENLAGKLSLLESAALMQKAGMNYVNDSAPLHLASAMNAFVTAIFCSTVPRFGFTPLSENSRVVEVEASLPCRPCGLHGHKSCPEGHFKCALDIPIEKVVY